MNSIILIQDEMLKEALPLLMQKKADEREDSQNQPDQGFNANNPEKKRKNT